MNDPYELIEALDQALGQLDDVIETVSSVGYDSDDKNVHYKADAARTFLIKASEAVEDMIHYLES